MTRRPPLTPSQCTAIFSAMREDEQSMFLHIFYGADPSTLPITPRTINQRLRRITRQARIDRRVTICNLQRAGRKLSVVELGSFGSRET